MGRTVALGLAGIGYDVAVECPQAPAAAGRLARQVARAGRRIRLLDEEPGQPEHPERLVEAIGNDFGRLDAIVTLPGSVSTEGPLSVVESLEGPFQLVRCAAPLLRETRGSVVHCLDRGDPASFQALRALTSALARVLAPWVRVNAVAPPPVDGTRSPEGEPTDPELVRSVLFVLASPYMNGEVVRVEPAQGR
jgi:NAD(P)-dependent dehydrogenase (short-subunit alcohol dehydrogenase family)